MTVKESKRVSRTSLVEEAIEGIRKVIQGNRLEPGDRLPAEPELGERLGVSRTVVREAMGRLEALGLVTVQHGRGTFVGDSDTLATCVKLVRSTLTLCPRELAQFHEFRTAIECQAVRRAALAATAGDLAELEELQQRIDQEGKDFEATVAADFAFHRKIVAMTGNDLLLGVLTVVQEVMIGEMLRTTPKPRDSEQSRAHHQAIVQAIRTHNADVAEAAMRAHMLVGEQRITQLRRESEGRRQKMEGKPK